MGIITEIPDEFINVDFSQEATHAVKSLGCIPRNIREEPLGSERRIYEEVAGTIPESEWDSLADKLDAEGSWLSELIERVYDQDGEPSCVSNAFEAAYEIKMAETIGPQHVVHLSAISLYRRVGSRNSGSTLSDNLREFRTAGVLPLNNERNKSLFAHTHPANGYGISLPSGWQETGKLFTLAEWDDIESYEGFVSAILRGHPVIYARSGHCILAVKTVGRGSSRKIGYLNSWGNWGSRLNVKFSYGLGGDTQSVVRRVASGAIALRSIQLPPELLTRLGIAA